MNYLKSSEINRYRLRTLISGGRNKRLPWNRISPNDFYKNKPLIYELLKEYPSGLKFKQCIKPYVDYGLVFEVKHC
jgi:hypothetical protein